MTTKPDPAEKIKAGDVFAQMRDLVAANCIESESDRRHIVQAIKDWDERGEFFSSTPVWFKAVIARGGAKYGKRQDEPERNPA